MRRTPQETAADRERVLAQTGREWATTADADAGSGRDPRQVYSDLRWLEEHGLIESRRVDSEKLLFFCIECRSVLTADNYDSCPVSGRHDVRPFHPKIKVWRLSATGLRTRRHAA